MSNPTDSSKTSHMKKPKLEFADAVIEKTYSGDTCQCKGRVRALAGICSPNEKGKNGKVNKHSYVLAFTADDGGEGISIAGIRGALTRRALPTATRMDTAHALPAWTSAPALAAILPL
ncbi:hypothetical protein Anapl_07756 [Anas platyrhynchos]|uniref:Uncharacterized protein n=1 Tax=Anas platyrhynchos TaxID=8839 RepID=R0M0M0_ANAPL|nr:hypothetical protein Anapl_07756 [Anas platyrhynchos]